MALVIAGVNGAEVIVDEHGSLTSPCFPISADTTLAPDAADYAGWSAYRKSIPWQAGIEQIHPSRTFLVSNSGI
jgi:hypothetical protein